MKKILGLVSLFLFFNAAIAQQNYPTHPIKPKGNYFLHTGFSFDAVLETAILSYNSITPVIAIVEYDVRFLDNVMIPRGTKLIGTCEIDKIADRVQLLFKVMVFPNGQEISMNGFALHTDGSGGVPGKKTDNAKKKFPAQTMLNVGAGALAVMGTPITAGLATGVQNITTQEMNAIYDYYIEVPKGRQILIFINNRMEY